jgi:hypothetical protein
MDYAPFVWARQKTGLIVGLEEISLALSRVNGHKRNDMI